MQLTRAMSSGEIRRRAATAFVARNQQLLQEAAARRAVVLKVLALEPIESHELYAVTGWPHTETKAVMDALVANGAVRAERIPVTGNNQNAARTRYHLVRSQ